MRNKAIAVILVILVLAAAGCAPRPPEKLAFSIATGGTAGVWYPLGGAISAQITQNVANTEATSEATTAAIDNLKLVVAKKAGMSFSYDYHVIWMNEGKLPAVSDQKQPVRIVMAFYEQPLHVVTKDGTGIKSLTDLKGKRVSTGAPNSGTEEQADYVLKALGIDWNKDFTREKLGAAESVAGLKDGKLDAFFWSGAVPTAGIIDLAATPGLKMVLLPISGDLAGKIMQANPGVFHKSKFAQGSYSSVDADVETLAITAVLNALDSFSADRVYQIISTVFDKKAEIAAVWKDAAKLTPEGSMAQLGPEAQKYMHSGAAKYFKEKGVLK
jgi:TRAP transporter TAXI family solute receptor